jgi:hypothetical protein
MPQSNNPFARLVDFLKYIFRGRDRQVDASIDKRYRSSQVPGGPFVLPPGAAKLTLGKASSARQAVLEATEQVTLFGSQSSGAGSVQDSLVAQQVARNGAYILLDVALDYERKDMLAHMHREVETLANFRVLNVDDPSQSHTYNPLVRGTAKAVAERIVSALMSPSYLDARMTDAEFIAAVELIALLVQALRDRDGVAQFRGLHEALESEEGFQALVSSPRIRPATKTDLAIRFAEFLTAEALRYDIDKIRRPLVRLLRLLPSFATGKIGQVLNVAVPEIDLLDGLNTRKGLLVMLPTMGKDSVAIALGRLVMSDLGDALEAKQALARDPDQPPALIVTVETPCLATGKLLQTFTAAKAAGVGIVAGVAASRGLECLSETDQNALLHNEATKVFFRSFANETSEALREFGLTLAQAGASRALPDLMAGLGNAPMGEGFISRGFELTHLAVWPQIEVPCGFERYQVPQRQPAIDPAVSEAPIDGATL